MKKYFLAEKMKYRHTFFFFILAAMPLASCFFSAVLTTAYFAVDSFNWWYIILFPAMTALICAMIGGKDLKQKNRTIFSLPVNMGKIWDAKILTAACATAAATGILLAGTLIGDVVLTKGLHVTLLYQQAAGMQIAAAFFIWLTSLWQIPLCLLLSQKFGTFAMVLIHTAVYTALASEVSLQPWFALLPQGITARLMCVMLKVLPNGLSALEDPILQTSKIGNVLTVLIGTVSALFWLLLLWVMSRRWFERQVKKQ